MAFFNIAAAVATVAGTYMSVQGQKASAKAAEQSSEWNADQARKQASYEESVAQKNMRRERENNRRELARMRALGARSGLAEAGAVSDNLIEASERHQTEIDDIWDRASTQAKQLRGQAQMSLWEGEQAKTASKYAIYGTVASGLTSVASSGAEAYGNYKASKPTPTPPVK
jgi:hypothetical protein